MNKTVKELCSFLDASHSVYHVQAHIAGMLEAAGYQHLMEHKVWDIQPGGKYYTIRGGSALVAFRVPEKEPKGFLMSASHADRPGFKLKDNYEINGPYTRVAVEGYGGMLVSTWLDRPLSVAGRVLVETADGVDSRLLDIDRDLLLIPNVAIHMNRQVNEGYKWNPALDAIPLAGGKDGSGKLKGLIEEAAGGKILGHDLYLYVRQKAAVWGMEEEYISSAGLDDLTSVWAGVRGLLDAQEGESIPVLCVFDNEEIGSSSSQGAASTLLPDILGRICDGLGLSLPRMLSQSFMVSADNGHALHPNHPELSDPANAPVMGGGIVLKYNANLRYCTDGVSAALFRKICAKAEVPVQSYHNRADIPGGSTLGRISLAQVSVPTVDLGMPQLAMHSCYETGAVADALYMEKAMKAYYSATLEATETGYTLR